MKKISYYSKKTTNLLIRQQKDMISIMKKLDITKIEEIINKLFSIYLQKGKIFTMGNGGSAATASHFTTDLSQNTTKTSKNRINAICLNDNISRITAIANDLGYKYIFKEQLKGILRSKDVIFVLSGSGNSPNIIQAIKYARKNKTYTVGLLGFDGGKALSILDLSLHIRSTDYTLIENVHMFVCDLITNSFNQKLSNL